MSTNVQHHANITLELNELYEYKNKRYGNSFGETYESLGIISAVTRILDKTNRLTQLATTGLDSEDESLRDTLIDLANYAIMTVMEIDKEGKTNEKL